MVELRKEIEEDDETVRVVQSSGAEREELLKGERNGESNLKGTFYLVARSSLAFLPPYFPAPVIIPLCMSVLKHNKPKKRMPIVR